jgi:hypothetical protein
VSDAQGGTDQAAVSIVLNTPPVAHAGGPYLVGEGAALALDGSGSTDAEQPAPSLGYAWDLDGDGLLGGTGQDVTSRADRNVAKLSVVLRLEGANAAKQWEEMSDYLKQAGGSLKLPWSCGYGKKKMRFLVSPDYS